MSRRDEVGRALAPLRHGNAPPPPMLGGTLSCPSQRPRTRICHTCYCVMPHDAIAARHPGERLGGGPLSSGGRRRETPAPPPTPAGRGRACLCLAYFSVRAVGCVTQRRPATREVSGALRWRVVGCRLMASGAVAGEREHGVDERDENLDLLLAGVEPEGAEIGKTPFGLDVVVLGWGVWCSKHGRTSCL